MPESDASRKVLAALADASREGRAKCGTDEKRWAPAGSDIRALLRGR